MIVTILAGLILSAAFALALADTASGASLHVSAEGSDNADGRSAGSPLRTLRAAAERAVRGDRILLRRGDVFRESAEIQVADVEVNAYGPSDAERPVIAGSEPITGWKRHDGEIYVAETEHDVGYLYVNGELMTIARYPNQGWLRTRRWEELARGRTEQGRRKLGKTLLHCPELAKHPRNDDGYWVGATIRWRHHSWWCETRPIVDYNARGDLTLGDRSFNDKGPHEGEKKGWGFYIDGKLEELDAPGEWYFDADEGKVYLYPPEGVDPNEALVEGTVRSVGLKVNGCVVKHLAFRHQKDIGLQINGRCIVEHCHFTGIGRDAPVSAGLAGGNALRAEAGVRNARVRHNVFEKNLNSSVVWNQDKDASGSCIVEHNVVHESGTVMGYGGSGAWHGVGILIATGLNVHVRYNEIDGTGYAGILLGSDGNFAEYNVIRNAMATMNDGAGIYTNCSRSTIRHNIILNTRGGMESSGDWQCISHGIWLEFLGEYRESVVEGNTCAGGGSDGIFLTNNYECLVRDNVLYDNARAQLLLIGRGRQTPDDPKQKHLVSGNVMFAARPGQRLLYYDPGLDYGTLRGNVFCSPFTDEGIWEGHGWPAVAASELKTVAEWQREQPWADAEAIVSPLAAGADHAVPPVGELFVNDTQETMTIALDRPYVDLQGNPGGESITLDPFTSVVLMPKS